MLLCGTHHLIIHSTPWQARLNPADRRPEFQAPGNDRWVRDRSGIDPAADPPEGRRHQRPAA